MFPGDPKGPPSPAGPADRFFRGMLLMVSGHRRAAWVPPQRFWGAAWPLAFFKSPFVILMFESDGEVSSVSFPYSLLVRPSSLAGANTPAQPAARIVCTQEFKWRFPLIEASFDVPKKQIPQSTPARFGHDPIYLNKGGKTVPCSQHL